ncbi:hypothetical protein AGMMS50229_20780 [Campylobacterota bacterium]|nr:hypothetical protein AGMMS50229_20780 [Campylobacterota bacterium]
MLFLKQYETTIEAIAGANSSQYEVNSPQYRADSAGVLPVENGAIKDNLLSINEVQNYYESVIKPKIDFDLSDHIKLNEEQLKTDQEAHSILSGNVKNLGDWNAFNTHAVASEEY